MNYKPLVIAISAIAAGGKSTVVQELAERLDDAVAIYFDDYTTPETYPDDPTAVLEAGADFNMIQSPLLAQHLNELRSGKAVVSPTTGAIISPARHIVFEGPLGRAQRETGQYVDFLVFIDTPLEVGLARMISRAIARPELETMDKDALLGRFQSMAGLIDGYLAWMRKGYLAQFEQIKPDSDLVLDWEQSPDRMVESIIGALAETRLI
ncbi:hypothetical protein KFU94_35100 [Chloroflexi bacterium TSY]|nr:hypothetical protein [Chloroflexi bacterium TSY]